MRILPLRTELGAGEDKQVVLLFNGSRRKLVQFTLRNKAILDGHKSSVPITIHCIAGSATLKFGDTGESIELMPGTLVTLEPNTLHEIKSNPAVSVLVTHFTDQ